MSKRCVLLAAVAALVSTALSNTFSQQAASPAPNVMVVTAEKRPVTESERFVGRIEAIERVDVRARGTGYLDAVLFKDGETVKIGAPRGRTSAARGRS